MSLSRYILPFILVIISGLMYVLYIDPTYTAILALRNDKVDYQNAIDNAGEVRDLQAKLLAEVEAIDPEDRARLEKILPSSHDPILVLYDLNTFAQKRGLALKTPTVTVPMNQQKAAQPQVTSVNIKFSVSAPYAVFRTFIAELERDLALKDIRSLTISGGGSDSAFESSVFTFLVEVEGHAYQGREKTKAPATGT